MPKDISIGVAGTGLGAALLDINRREDSRLTVRAMYDPAPERPHQRYEVGKHLNWSRRFHGVDLSLYGTRATLYNDRIVRDYYGRGAPQEERIEPRGDALGHGADIMGRDKCPWSRNMEATVGTTATFPFAILTTPHVSSLDTVIRNMPAWAPGSSSGPTGWPGW